MIVKRSGLILKPQSARVLVRRFVPKNEERIVKIIARVSALSEEEVCQLIKQVLDEFVGRHQKLKRFLIRQFEEVRRFLVTDTPLSEERQLLIGSYFTQEYALESAGLLNPSMIWHPDQSGIEEGSKRFILSLRAIGEGHISSITFRTGVIDAENRIALDIPSAFATSPEVVPHAAYDRSLFERKLMELGFAGGVAAQVLSTLPDLFSYEDLQSILKLIGRQHRAQPQEFDRTSRGIMTLAQANYEVEFTPDEHLSARIIFPTSPTEARGIEDARFVEFREDDGQVCYYATYSAYDGEVVLPQILETADFLRFCLYTLNGPEVQNKGMALFPRRIDGQYAMISRQDNENIYLMYSDMLHFWHTKEPIVKPTFPWEFVQLGNCGSPIETEEGWLVLSHGVGPMRKYAIGAFLLDLHDPRKVIGRLVKPLLTPEGDEWEGYVPNVVYSCGGQVHNGELIVPYAMSDYASSFATVPLKELLAEMDP